MNKNKTEFVEFMAEKHDISKVEAKKALDMVLTSITEALENGDEINLTGFGKFSVVHKDEGEARNPSTGGTITVPAHDVPKFSFSKAFKDSIR